MALTASRSQDFGLLFVVILIGFWLVAIGGWIANIVKIFGSTTDPLSGFFIIRCVGVVVAPIGAVLGFL